MKPLPGRGEPGKCAQEHAAKDAGHEPRDGPDGNQANDRRRLRDSQPDAAPGGQHGPEPVAGKGDVGALQSEGDVADGVLEEQPG